MRRPSGGRQRLRHLMVVHAHYPGHETRVQREAAALVARGFEVDVVCLRERGEPRRGQHDGVRVHRLPVRRHPGRGFASQLVEYVAFFLAAAATVSILHLRRRYDAVQVHNLPDFLVFCAVVPKLTGTPVLLDIHDLMPEFFATRADVPAQHRLVRLVRWQERVACRFADHVVTVTDVWLDTLAARGVGRDKLSVVMNVADSRIFSPSVRQGNGAHTGGHLHLLYHGTFARRYGVDLLVEAVAQLRDEVPGLRLTLQGDGELRDDLIAMRERLGVTDHVTISTGFVEPQQVAALIGTADIGVVPTRRGVLTDGILPTKLMEYVATGTPVIAARTPTVESYFPGDMVALFEPGDVASLSAAIRAAVRDRPRLTARAERADAFNRAHDWESTASAYAGLVAALAGGAPMAAPPARPDGHVPRCRVRTSAAEVDEAWDAFLAAQPGASHTQASLWARVKAPLGWQAVRVIAEREGRIAGGAQLLYRRVAPFTAAGYIARGPVLEDDDAELGARVLDAVEEAARALGIRHLTVQPPGPGDAQPAYLAGRRYLETTVEVAPRATVLIDVRRDPEQILAAMPAKTRRNTRLAGRKGVTVRSGGRADLATFHGILESTAARQGFTAFPCSYFEHLWDVLAPGGHAWLGIAEHDDEPLAAVLAVGFGDTAVYKYGAWTGQAGNRHPNEALHWAALQWAHERGHQSYDLEGIKLRIARQWLAGDQSARTNGSAVSGYKLGFGGTVVVLPAAQVHVPNPLLRLGVQRVYPRLQSRKITKAIGKAVRRGAGGGGRRRG